MSWVKRAFQGLRGNAGVPMHVRGAGPPRWSINQKQNVARMDAMAAPLPPRETFPPETKKHFRAHAAGRDRLLGLRFRRLGIAKISGQSCQHFEFEGLRV